MVHLRIMNSDGVRRDNGFCRMTDPDIINKDILSIINNLYKKDYKVLDFNDPFIQSIKVEYYSCDNPYGWGLYPLYWAYTDMMNYIGYKFSQGLITNNFLTKVEEVFLEPSSRYRVYCWDDNTCPCNIATDNSDMGYDIMTDYLASKYSFDNYAMMSSQNPRLMWFICDEYQCLDSYILTAGFNPFESKAYFCPSTKLDFSDINLPHSKYYALMRIVQCKLGKNTPSVFGGTEFAVNLQRGGNFKLVGYKECLEYVHRYDFCNLKKTMEYDMQQDQEVVYMMGHMKPAVYQVFADKDGHILKLSSLNHTPNVRMDYKLYKQQNQMIREAELKFRYEHPELFKEDPNKHHLSGEEMFARAEQEEKERKELAAKMQAEQKAKKYHKFLNEKKYGAFTNRYY